MVKKMPPTDTRNKASPSKPDPAPKVRTTQAREKRRKGGQAKENRTRLHNELEALRVSTNEVLEQVSLRLNAELAEVTRRVDAEAAPGAEARKIPGKTAALMLTVVRELRLKPKKGRLKDLTRIEYALEQMLQLTAPNT